MDYDDFPENYPSVNHKLPRLYDLADWLSSPKWDAEVNALGDALRSTLEEPDHDPKKHRENADTLSHLLDALPPDSKMTEERTAELVAFIAWLRRQGSWLQNRGLWTTEV